MVLVNNIYPIVDMKISFNLESYLNIFVRIFITKNCHNKKII